MNEALRHKNEGDNTDGADCVVGNMDRKLRGHNLITEGALQSLAPMCGAGPV